MLILSKNRCTDTIQRIFLINLGLIEIVLILTGAVHVIVKAYGSNLSYFSIFRITGMIFVYYAVMTMLTIYRFFQVYLNLKLPLHWNLKKTYMSLTFTWVFGLVIGISTCILTDNEHKVWRVCTIYFFPACDCVLIACALFTYTYIFLTIRQGNMETNGYKSSDDKKIKNNSSTKKKLNNFVPFLLVVTYVIFMFLPNQVWFVSQMFYPKLQGQLLNTICIISWCLGYISDATVYVILSPIVKDLIKRRRENSDLTTPRVFGSREFIQSEL